MQGAPTGPGNNVRKPLSLLCVLNTCKINLGGLDFRFKITEVLEHINGRENKKNEEDLSHHFLESSFVDRNQSFRTSASFEDRNASNFMS